MNKNVLPPATKSAADAFALDKAAALPRRKQRGKAADEDVTHLASEEGLVVADAGGQAGPAAARGGAAGVGTAAGGYSNAGMDGSGEGGRWAAVFWTWGGVAGLVEGGQALRKYYDKHGASAPAPVQQAPVASAVSVGGTEDATSIAGAASASDANNDALTYSLVAAAPAGLTFNADGTFSYVPQAADVALDEGESRTVSFDYVANDGIEDSAPATVTITISGVNDAPVSGGAASASGSEDDAGITGSVPVASDVDVETLTYALAAAAPAGLTFNADGTFSYVPQAADNALDSGETRTVTFDYVANDGTTNSAAATVTITISGANDAPVSGGTASASGTEDDASITGSVPAASDVDVEALTYALTAAAPAGLTFNPDGTFSYVPQAADNALDSGESRTVTFDYVANDGTVDSAPATVTITISGANDAPVTGGIASASGTEDDASISGSVPAASDVDVEALTYALTAAAPAGLTFNSNGTFSYVPQAADNALDSGESRTVTFDYVANDGAANSTAATVTITISGANDAPVSGGAASASGSEDDASITGSVPAASDADVETLTYALTAAAPAGFTLNPNGTFSYTPQAIDQTLAQGASRTVAFDYVANDGTANSAPATATITITGVNDAPVSGGGASLTGNENDYIIGLNLPAGSDVDGDPLSYEIVGSAPAGFNLSPSGNVSYVMQAADEALDTGESRQVSLQYAVNDGWASSAAATVTFTITGANDAPVSGGSGSISGSEDDASIDGQVPAATDIDGEPLYYGFASLAPAGLTLNSDGSFSYVPQAADNALDSGESRTVSFDYVATDGVASSAPATMTITITGANDAPVGVDDSASTDEDVALVIDTATLLANDTDADVETLSVTAVGNAVGGSVSLSGSTITFTPTANYNGAASFEYTLSDGTTTDVALASLTVNAVNDAPVIGAAATTPTTTGAEFRINTETNAAQEYVALTGLAGGGFVATWQSWDQDGDLTGIYGQLYAADGSTVGGEFHVSTATVDFQAGAAVAALPGGGFVVTWESYGQDGESGGIYAQRYAADGSAAGGEFLINTTTAGWQGQSAIAALADGSFVVTWGTSNADWTGFDIMAQRFAANGSTVGSEFRVNTTTTTDIYLAPAVAALSGGGFVVTWQSNVQDGSGFGICGQRYDAAGVAVGSEFQVNTTTAGNQTEAVTAGLAGGGFVVLWTSDDGSGNGIYGQRYAADGSAAGSEFRVNTTTANTQSLAAVAALADGGFLVTWGSDGQDGSGSGVYGQRFAADGSPVGVEFLVNTYTNDGQAAPAVAALADGSVVVAWTSVDQDGSWLGLYGQRFETGGLQTTGSLTEGDATTIASGLLTASDVDAGDTLAWSISDDSPASSYGSMAIAADGTWTYTLNNSAPATIALNDGDTVTETFTATVTDSQGAIDTQAVTITITGTGSNSAPVIVAVASELTPTVGSEFRLNTTTVGDQANPALAALAGGGFVATWDHYDPAGVGRFIYAQRYDATGAAVGGEFQVNTTMNGVWSVVTALAGGGFVVSWMCILKDGDGWGICAQRYDATGAAVGGELQVNTTAVGDQMYPALTALAGGGFVVSWTSDGQDGWGHGVYAQRFDAVGDKVGGEFRVNTTTDGSQSYPALATLAGGGFVVSWMSSDEQDGSGYGIYAQRYDATGAAVGGEFQVNTSSVNDQVSAEVTALAGGGFVVSWMSWGQDGDGYGIYAQRFDASGVALGSEFRINTTTAGQQLHPVLTALPDGGFVASWASSGQDGSGYGVYAQRFDATGAAVGSEFLVNTVTTNDQNTPALTALADGSIVASWHSSGQDGDSGGIYAQRFRIGDAADTGRITAGAATNTASDQLTVSDADVGDTHTWSIDTASPYGSMAIAGDGTWTFTLDNNAAAIKALAEGQVATHTFTATVTDSAGASDTHPVTISITGANDAPVVAAAPSAASGSEDDASITGSVIGSDPDGDTLTYSIVGATPAGLTFNSDGSFSYVPQAADNALAQGGSRTVTFDYRANDGTVNGNTATATITVSGVNDAPVISGSAPATTPVAAGDEFRVNTTTSDDQNFAAVTALAGGGFVVSWTSWGQDGDQGGIYAQRYDASGTAVGSEFRLNTATANSQETVALTALAGGGFVATWTSWNQDGDGPGIYAQRFDASGVTVGSEFQVNTWTAYEQLNPAVVGLAGGGFVVAWESWTFGDDPFSYGIYAQRYDASGVAQGGEFLVNTYIDYDQQYPTLTALAGGGFVVSWQSYGQDGAGNGIFAQRFDAAGAKVGGEFQVNTTSAAGQLYPALTALTGGGFVASWQSFDQDGDSWGVYAQRYDASGVAVGSEFRVNTTTAQDQDTVALTALADGGFLASWQSLNQDGDDYGIYAQRFDAAGAKVGGEFRGNTTTALVQFLPALTTLADGSIVAAWQSDSQDGAGYGIYAQRFSLDTTLDAGRVTEGAATTTASAQLAVSDVDAGDTQAWSIVDDTPASSYGSMVIAADGTWTFTLDNNALATRALDAASVVTETFTATVTDSQGATDTQAVTITITGTGGAYRAGADGVDDALSAGAFGDYLDGMSGVDTLTGGAGSDTFDGGAGDDVLIDTAASDDIYIFRGGADGFDTITESTDPGSDADELRIIDMSGALDFSAVGGDLYILLSGDPANGVLVKDFFTADQSALNADIETVATYWLDGVTVMQTFTSQDIYDNLFP